MSGQLGPPEGTLHERSVTPDISPKIRSPAMRVIKAGTKGGLHDGVFLYRCIGDFGISVFHRPGRFYRPETSSLNRVRGDSIPSGGQGIEQSVFDRIGFAVVHEIQHGEKEKVDLEKYSGHGCWGAGDGVGNVLPGG